MKFEIEKVLHEVIRDLPEAQKANKMFKLGYITADDALKAIAEAMKASREAANR